MGNARGRATFAVVLAAHAALFVLLAISLRPKTAPLEPELVVAPVYLADLRRKPRARPEREARPTAAATRAPAVLARPFEASDPAVPPAASTPPVAAPAGDGEAERLALSQALRGSRVGCANPALLSDKERERCEDRLEQGSKLAKYIPTPIPAERRAYYDAIIKAKAPPKPTPPGPDPVRSALLGYKPVDPALRGMTGSIPGVGCKLAFGGPKGTGGWKKPAHSLKLGPLPCFVMPPQGSLTPEVGIQNPDSYIKDKKKAAGEF